MQEAVIKNMNSQFILKLPLLKQQTQLSLVYNNLQVQLLYWTAILASYSI